MKSMVLRHSDRIAAAILAVALAVVSAPAKAQSTESAAAPLEGTWRVQVTQYVCANPTITFPPFKSVLSFQRGGTESETTSNPALVPGQRTSGYGFWEAASASTFCSADPAADYFSATEAFILFDSPTTPPGLKKGVQKILQCITMTDENDWSANASVRFFNADGTTTTGCATATGVRLTDSTTTP
jgi:hypothetical protein